MAAEVTRIEIADHLRPHVRAVLAALPDDRRYTELRQF